MGQSLGGSGEVEALKDVALTLRQLHGMNDAAQVRALLDQWTDAEGAEDAFRGQTFFGDGGVVGDCLATRRCMCAGVL